MIILNRENRMLVVKNDYKKLKGTKKDEFIIAHANKNSLWPAANLNEKQINIELKLLADCIREILPDDFTQMRKQKSDYSIRERKQREGQSRSSFKTIYANETYCDAIIDIRELIHRIFADNETLNVDNRFNEYCKNHKNSEKIAKYFFEIQEAIDFYTNEKLMNNNFYNSSNIFDKFEMRALTRAEIFDDLIKKRNVSELKKFKGKKRRGAVLNKEERVAMLYVWNKKIFQKIADKIRFLCDDYKYYADIELFAKLGICKRIINYEITGNLNCDNKTIIENNSNQYNVINFCGKKEFDSKDKLMDFLNNDLNKNPSEKSYLKHTIRSNIRYDNDVSIEQIIKTFALKGLEFDDDFLQRMSDNDYYGCLVLLYNSLIDLTKILNIDNKYIGNNELFVKFKMFIPPAMKSGAIYTGKKKEITISVDGFGAIAHEWAHYLYELILDSHNEYYKTFHLRDMQYYKAENLRDEMQGFLENKHYEMYIDDLIEKYSNSQQELYEIKKMLYLAQTANEFIEYLQKRIPDCNERNNIIHSLRNSLLGVKVKRDFYINALMMDSHSNKGDKYYSIATEMFARAFEKYIYTKMRKMNFENNFLVNLIPRYANYLYPAGVDQEFFEQFFDNVAKNISFLKIEKPHVSEHEADELMNWI